MELQERINILKQGAEIAQKNGQKVEYVLLQKLGKSHNPTFIVEAKLGNIVEKAESSSKQNAEQIAAKKILDKLGENNEF